LLETTYSYNYEQVNDTDLTVEETAAEAYTRYVAWLDAVCGGDCPTCEMPGGGRVYRVSPDTGHYEYLEDGEWVEDADIPPIPEREEGTAPDRVCAAAANAVEVVRLTWIQALADFDASMAAQDALIDTVDGIAATIGAVFYPPILALFAMTQVGWEIVYTAYGLLTAVDWDDALTELLTCTFVEHGTDTAGVVTFDVGAILTDIWDLSLRGGVYITMAGQLQWILGTIGPDGVNTAGSLDLVEGDCSSCDGWCQTFNFATGPQGWTAVRETANIYSAPGVWTGGRFLGTLQTNTSNAWSQNATIGIQFPDTEVTEVSVVYSRTNGQITSTINAQRILLDNWDGGVDLGNRQQVLQANTPGAQGTNISITGTGTFSNVGSITIAMAASFRSGAVPSPVGTIEIHSVTLRGNGTNPFGVDNC